MGNVSNPFILTGYQGKRYFCDRKEETKTLLDNLVNGRSTTIMSIRRMGKTGLIKHVLSQLPKGYAGIYIDILPTENLDGMLNRLSSAVFNSLPQRVSAGKKVIDFIKSLRPVVTYDPLTGQPQLTFDTRPGEPQRHIDSIFRYLENYPQKIILAIDEFQQILEYPEENADAWLRSILQSLNNITFVFSGSQQHLMAELFSDPSRPFFRSTSFLHLDKINAREYAAFIKRHFQQAGKEIDKEVIHEMMEWTDLHTYYVQLLCNRVYSFRETDISSKLWKITANSMLQEQEMIFFKYRDLLSKQQWQLLKAIASEGKVKEITSKNFIAKYSLGSPSTVVRSQEALLHKEMIYSAFDHKGVKYYSVYDVLFRRWMEGKAGE